MQNVTAWAAQTPDALAIVTTTGTRTFAELDANANAVLDTVTFGAQTLDRSYGRSAGDADVFLTLTPTPGTATRSTPRSAEASCPNPTAVGPW